MPTYRLDTDAIGSQYILLTTAVDASEVPTFDFDNYTDMQNGTTTDADKAGVRMLLQIAALGATVRPMVTDYLSWGIINVPYTSAIDFEIDDTISLVSGTYLATRDETAVTEVEAQLAILGRVSERAGPAQVMTDVTDLTFPTGPLTLTEFPADWSGPALVP